MSLTTSEMTPADIAAVCGNNRNNDGFGFGDGNGAWWIIILFLFGWGRNGFGGGYGGSNTSCGCSPCATQADVRAAVDQQTLLSKIDQQTYGVADTFTALNNTLNNNFRGIDNAICTLGYQNQAGVNAISAQLAQCCCDTRSAIKDVGTGVERTGWNLSKQLGDCCCDIEKMNLQSRFDAQAYNCNTLQAIDKLGDRIIDYMSNEKLQTLRDENQALRLAASQSAQNAFITANQEAQTAELIRRLGRDCPVPAYVVPNPNCCYNYSVQPNCGCNGGF